MSKFTALLIGPLFFLCILLIGDSGNIQVKMIAVAAWMLSWWITNALPIGVTALLPMLLFPLMGIIDLKTTTANYAHPVIYLFFGGFVLGLAIEKWNLHKRIALNILNLSGDKPTNVILGCMLATSLLSMWISNTATTVMMLPIGLSVIQLVGKKLTQQKQKHFFSLSLLLGIAYAANVGGIGTLIGTPPNLVMSSILSENGFQSITFSSWMLFAMPLVVVLFSLVFFLNNNVIFPVKSGRIDGMKALVSHELAQLGKIQTGEKRVILVLCTTALLWIIRAPLSKIEGLEALSDPIIAILAVLLLFTIPAGNKTSSTVLVWDDMKKLPWGILLLFGGGMSLAKGLEKSELVLLIGDWISANVGGSSIFIVMLVVTVFALFLTEVMSNVALVAVFVPVAIVIAESLELSTVSLAIPLTIAASCAFMFPISTPPNAVVFASGEIDMKSMMKAGFFLNLIAVAIVTTYCYFIIPLCFG